MSETFMVEDKKVVSTVQLDENLTDLLSKFLDFEELTNCAADLFDLS